MDGPSAAARRGPRPERPPHHISAIAHLFLDDGAEQAAAPGQSAGLDLAVACLGDGRASAWACAGLVDAAREAGSSARRAGVRLTEDSDLLWSAGSHLVSDRTGGVSGGQGGTARVARWAWAGRGPGDSWVRWAHFGALDPTTLAGLESLAGAARTLTDTWGQGGRLPGCDGLAVCLPAEQSGHLGSAYVLGRLVQALGPRRLEVLLLPAGWRPGAAGSGGAGRGLSAEVPARELDQGRRLAALAAPRLPVAVTAVPVGGQPGPQVVLRDLAARLTAAESADFSVDLTF